MFNFLQTIFAGQRIFSIAGTKTDPSNKVFYSNILINTPTIAPTVIPTHNPTTVPEVSTTSIKSTDEPQTSGNTAQSTTDVPVASTSVTIVNYNSTHEKESTATTLTSEIFVTLISSSDYSTTGNITDAKNDNDNQSAGVWLDLQLFIIGVIGIILLFLCAIVAIYVALNRHHKLKQEKMELDAARSVDSVSNKMKSSINKKPKTMDQTMEYECEMASLQDTNHQNKSRGEKDAVSDEIVDVKDDVDYINYNDRTEGQNNNVNDNDNDATDTESNESMYNNINGASSIQENTQTAHARMTQGTTKRTKSAKTKSINH